MFCRADQEEAHARDSATRFLLFRPFEVACRVLSPMAILPYGT
jgi:hypothetical protein